MCNIYQEPQYLLVMAKVIIKKVTQYMCLI